MMKIGSTLIVVAVFVSGCSSTQQAGQAMQASWIGKRSDDFFVKHGAAQRDQQLSDGRRVYVWQTSSNASMGGPRVWCSADIVADRSGLIIEIRPREDSIGLMNTSRCAEIFGS